MQLSTLFFGIFSEALLEEGRRINRYNYNEHYIGLYTANKRRVGELANAIKKKVTRSYIVSKNYYQH